MGKCQHAKTTTTVVVKHDGDREYKEIKTVCLTCFRAIQITTNKKD